MCLPEVPARMLKQTGLCTVRTYSVSSGVCADIGGGALWWNNNNISGERYDASMFTWDQQLGFIH